MTPNDILLYSKISALFSHRQRCFIWQQMGTDAETQRWILCEERPKRMGFHQIPPPQCSRISVEEEVERVRVRRDGGYQEKNAL